MILIVWTVDKLMKLIPVNTYVIISYKTVIPSLASQFFSEKITLCPKKLNKKFTSSKHAK